MLICPDCGKQRPLTHQAKCDLKSGVRKSERCKSCAVDAFIARRKEEAAARLPERFWSQVKRTDGCWLWQGKHCPKGYGFLKVGRRTVRAHRIAWQLTHGEIPDGLCVLHRCDVRNCVRPDHLFLGTQADNVADMVAKGRRRGAKRATNA